MNAYELADELDGVYADICNYGALRAVIDGKQIKVIANMLRQQADRITELEKLLRSMVEMMNNNDEHGYGSQWHKEAIQALEGITPQTKPLSDEEILKMAANMFHYTEYKHSIDFARAIEKEHGIL